MRGDQYGSLWPPSEPWDGYDGTRSGQVVQFLDGFGNVGEGRLAESQFRANGHGRNI